MEAMKKVLIVDKSSDRKKRIGAIKERGFAVFPALRLQEARSRCRPGAYDLVVVHAGEDSQAALAFCQQLQDRRPPQAVLLVMPANGGEKSGENLVSDSPEAVAAKVEEVLGRSETAGASVDEPEQNLPSRAVA